jgi:glycosyltransferase involved in cell wall biosynthesis
MKILYIITQADGGGAQKYTLCLAKAFGGTIAAGSGAGQLFMAAKDIGIPCIELKHLKRRVNLWEDCLAVWEIRRLVKNENPDIVHLNSSKAGVLGSFACIGLKKKVVFTAHGFVFNEPLGAAVKNFYLALEKIASGYRDYIITVSDADRQSALNYKLIGANKITTIHNGIRQIEFFDKQQARAALKLSDDKFTVGALANFYKTKGLDILIDAAGMLEGQERSKIQVAIIGDGQEGEDLRLKIKDLRLEDQIILLGKTPNASKYLKAFDIFILPSRKEGIPFALLEAMQAGLPIIAAKVGGIPEALGDAGILVEPEKPKELAQAIKSLLGDEAKQKELSQKALERSKQFTEKTMLSETEKIYRQILN